MKRVLILAATVLPLAGCNLTAGQQVLVASAVVQGFCTLADATTGAAVAVTQARLPAGSDPSLSKTLATWKAGNTISNTQCAQLAQALSTTGQQIVAIQQTTPAK